MGEGPESVRLFVGGLGPAITAADLQRAFGSLGTVSSVELIRDFAYVDFQAASPAALRNVFSTYQGCKWKGGCVRVEKAKEDYLSRLKREWETDATASRKTGLPAVEPDFSSLHDLKMFFPQAGKLKAVPANGSGRHKRSFQRWNSHPLALLTLCSCEGPEDEAVDPFNYEHDTYLRLVEKLEDKLSSKTSQADENANKKTKVSTMKNDFRRTQSSDKDRKRAAIAKDKEQPAEAADEKEKVELSEDEDNEPSDIDGVSVPGLRKRKPRAIEAPTNMWGKIFEAAAGLKDEDADDEEEAFEEDVKPEDSARKRVKFTEETSKYPERTSSDHGKGHAGKRRFVEQENNDAGKSEHREDEHQTQWVQTSSWKSLAGNGGSFSLAGRAGSKAESAAAAADYGLSRGKESRNSQEKINNEVPIQRVEPPSVESLLKNKTCSFMRSSNAEAEWLSSKEKLRSDYRARHKTALKRNLR